MRQTKNIKASGFTLIELSLVLVIIGLIVGGVLVGQDLINAATIRSQIKQLETLEIEINNFKLKYNCVPGDCVDATTFLPSTFAGHTIYNGNGDGYISGQVGGTGSNAVDPTNSCLSGNSNPGSELEQLFVHIMASDAGYTIKMNPAFATDMYNGGISVTCLNRESPQNASFAWYYMFPAFKHGTGIFFGLDARYGTTMWYSLAGYSNLNSPPYLLHIPYMVAQSIDTKIDDGKADTGEVGVLRDSCHDWHSPAVVPYNYTSAPAGCNVSMFKRLWE